MDASTHVIHRNHSVIFMRMFVLLLDLGKQLILVSLLKSKKKSWLYRQAIRSYLEILSRTQFLDADAMRSLQSRRLKKVLRAAARARWWESQFAHAGLQTSATAPLDEIKKIPPQKKSSLVRIQPEHLYSQTNTQPLLWRTTTGTDGMPITWAQDMRTHFIEYAAYYLRSLEHFSFPVRENLTKKFFCMFNYPGVDDYYLSFFARGIYLRYMEEGAPPSPEERRTVYDTFDATGPWVLYGAPSALWFLAQQAESDRIKITPSIIVFSGETMPDDIFPYLEKVFSCPVRSFYGTRELGTIGFSCNDNKNIFHLNSEHIYLEVLDDAGNRCVSGHYGNLTMTSLTNCAMPLLRYQPGDIGRFIDEPCACKTKLPRFELLGRTSEFLMLPDGKNIPIWPLYEALFADGRIHKIRQYQVQQVMKNTLVVFLVKKSEWGNTDTKKLMFAIKKKMGAWFRVEIKFIESIEKHGRKHRPFIQLNS